jgi:hypothetical protein
MGASAEQQPEATFVTLGPEGTCHERAVKEYAHFQGVENYEIELIDDFFDGLEKIRGKSDWFLVQCSAHTLVGDVTERYWREVFVVDTFIYPTKALAVLTRREVERPRTLGLVPCTSGYVDLDEWEETIGVQSKPIVAEELLRGEYDSGLTHLEHAEFHPDRLRVDLEIGEIDTTWVVYGTAKRFQGEVIGIPSASLYREPAHALS